MFAAAPLVLAINHLLAAAEWARLRLLPFAGQRLRLEIGPVRLGFVLMETGLFATDAAGEAVDAAAVHITLPPDTPLLLLRDASLVMQQTQISGNVDFAETLNFVFRHLEWDAEADLAGLIGDMPARRLTLLGQALR
ncbi:MAG: hypothetical protein LBS89_07185, partial [Zoogloeaceae bacterium]|nr:hypothetical protein [Zoogloeaceae bacterium]